MWSSNLEGTLLETVRDWIDAFTKPESEHASRYLVSVGLVALERLRDGWPIALEDLVSDKPEVRTSGALVQKILARYGVIETFTRSGGRTTASALAAALSLVERLNAMAPLGTATETERQSAAEAAQRLLARMASAVVSAEKLKVHIDLFDPSASNVARLLQAPTTESARRAAARNFAEAVLTISFGGQRMLVNWGTFDGSGPGLYGLVHGDTMFAVGGDDAEVDFDRMNSYALDGGRVMWLPLADEYEDSRVIIEEEPTSPAFTMLPLEPYIGTLIDAQAGLENQNLESAWREALDRYSIQVNLKRVVLPIRFDISMTTPAEPERYDPFAWA